MKLGHLVQIRPNDNKPASTYFCVCVGFKRKYLWVRVLARTTDLGTIVRGRNNIDASFKYGRVVCVLQDKVTKWRLDI